MTSRPFLRTLPSLMVLLALWSCDRRDVELYYEHETLVRLTFDWESAFGEKPSGMTLMLADLETDKLVHYSVSNDVDEKVVNLPAGTYRVLAFNRTFEEYGSMTFGSTQSCRDIYAKTELQHIHQSQGWDAGVDYGQEPERIGVAVDTITVLPEWEKEIIFTDYRNPHPNEAIQETFPETVYPMTTQLHIYVKVIGYPYVEQLEGNITGMADGFKLSQIWRNDQETTHRLDNWRTKAENDSVAWLSTVVSTFGLPHGRELVSQRDSTDNVITLDFTLKDGSQIFRRYNVGKLIRYIDDNSDLPNYGDSRSGGETGAFNKMNVTLRLELTLEEGIRVVGDGMPMPTPPGFDADVDPWDDEDVIDVHF